MHQNFKIINQNFGENAKILSSQNHQRNENFGLKKDLIDSDEDSDEDAHKRKSK